MHACYLSLQILQLVKSMASKIVVTRTEKSAELISMVPTLRISMMGHTAHVIMLLVEIVNSDAVWTVASYVVSLIFNIL